MIEFRMLGTLELRALDGRPLHALLAQPKRVALLAYLAVASPRGFHRRDTLLGVFWPNSDALHARTALRKAIHVLRRSLGEDVLLARGDDELAINHELIWTDLRALDDALEAGRVCDALELYRGDLLAGFVLEDVPQFERWLEAQRKRVRTDAASAARRAAEEHESEQNFTAAVGCARRAAELSDLDERALRRLMELLERLGDRAGAIHAYDAFAQRLAAEHGTTPSPDTRAIIERVRASGKVPIPGSPLGARAGASAPGKSLREKWAGTDMRVVDTSFSLSPQSDSTEDPVVPGYVIERELGSGGMACVYLATDIKHGRQVAIKMLHRELLPTLATARFLSEIRITAGLAHPHILPLLDSGTSDGTLYFVMPYVAGETVRALLERDHRLEVRQAVRIASEVADALDYAHRMGVVHRDIKPENILLEDGHAVVADFGIARALDASRTSLTEAGTVVGSRNYMSPEQACGIGNVDARSDVYSLGCVLREMLGGIGVEIAEPLERTIARATAAEPSERFLTAGEFRAALDPDARSGVARDPPSHSFAVPVATAARQVVGEISAARLPMFPLERARVWLLAQLANRRFVQPVTIAVLGLAVATSALWALARLTSSPDAPLSADSQSLGSRPEAPLDTSRYAVLPLEYDSSVGTPRHEGQLLRDAMARWSGISIVDAFQMNDAMSRNEAADRAAYRPMVVAAQLGAGRYVRTSASRVGDFVRLYAALYDTRSDSLLAEHTVQLGGDAPHAEALVATLADRLLFRGADPAARTETNPGTRSVPALQAYMRGQAAIARWDLPLADSEFVVATRFDPQYAVAFLWLAQVRSWNGAVPARWRYAAEHAAAGRSRLSSRDQLMADALLALGRGDVQRACPLWERLTVLEPHDFASWYGLGHCLRYDDAVVRDRSSISGWRFRTSYHRAIEAYQRAFQLLPSIHRSLHGRSFEPVRRILKTSAGDHRVGRGLAPDSTRFRAYPSWLGDSLVLVPFPVEEFTAGNPRTLSRSIKEAVLHQRRQFHDIATTWRVSFPQSAYAAEALALSLQLLGDASALDTIRAARVLTTGPMERLRLAGVEVWMRFQYSVPGDIEGLRAARQLADSLMQLPPSVLREEPGLIASLAALTGRAQLAATYARLHAQMPRGEPDADNRQVPALIARDAPALLAFAAMGGPADSLRTLEQRVLHVFRTNLAGVSRTRAQFHWLMRAASLAYPDVLLTSTTEFAGHGDYLVDAQAAAVRGDSIRVRQILEPIRAARRFNDPADLTMDGVYPEAALLASLGQHELAIQWLDPTLRSLSIAAPEALGGVERAGSMVRAMALRAELAAQVGDDAGARRWSGAVTALWSDADPFLQPLVRRMAHLSR